MNLTFRTAISGIILVLGLALSLAAFGLFLWDGDNFGSKSMRLEVAIAKASSGINSRTAPSLEDLNFLEKHALNGHPIAQNNLALILRRTKGTSNRNRADALLRAAASQGLAEAKYNIAYFTPNRHKTDPELVRQSLNLLRSLVGDQDPHAAALMADALYYNNREEYEPNSQGKKVDLLHMAASSGDIDYKLSYASELWDLARFDHRFLVPQVIEALLEVHKAGDPRGAQTIASVIKRWPDDTDVHLRGTDLGTNRFDWLEHAAQAGVRTAACSYAIDVFREISRFDASTKSATDLAQIIAGIYQNTDPNQIEAAERHLGTCHSGTSPAREGRSNPAFGSPALYAGKARPGWVALVNSPGYARIIAGALSAFHPTRTPNLDQARDFFSQARDKDDFDNAEAFLRLVN